MNVIILNGPSSSGKTSIGKYLQDIMEENYVMLGLDNIIYTMPKRTNDYEADMRPRDGFYWIANVDKDGAPLMHLTPGVYAQKLYRTLIAQVKCFADNGINVIVDHVSLMDDYWLWRDALIDHHLICCSITAEQEILDQREKERGDRVIGGSRAQMMTVHDGYKYDIFIDTSFISSLEAAEKIHALVGEQKKAISIMCLKPSHTTTIVSAFNKLGWNKPASVYEGYLKEQEAGERIVWVAFANRHGEQSEAIQQNNNDLIASSSPIPRNDVFAGYVTLKWQSQYQSFKAQNIPEIMDLNVLPDFRKMGIGSLLLDTAEKEAAMRSATIGIGVGLYAGADVSLRSDELRPDYSGYGAAQRIYVKRGYIPDGKGVTYNYEPTIPGNSYPLDDDLVLWFTKKLF